MSPRPTEPLLRSAHAAKRERLSRVDPAILYLDPPEVFDAALIGHTADEFRPTVAIYSYAMLVEALVAEGADDTQAREYIDFNIVGAWVGDRTPIVCTEPDWDGDEPQDEAASD